MRVTAGAILDVADDVRKSSPTFGTWLGATLSLENKRTMWVPEGFAHDFILLSEVAKFLYKATDYLFPEYEQAIIWNDADLAIQSPITTEPILASKDAVGKLFLDAEYFSF